MYYSKSLDSSASTQMPEFDARNILRVLNYFPFINRRHVDGLKEAMKDPKWVELFCDMSAATITQLHERKMIDLHLVWKTVSQFFHQAIQLRGFETVPHAIDEFADDRKAGVKVDFMVAGTQSPTIFQARVDRCIDTIRMIQPMRCHITFSGANPYGNMKRLGIPGGVITINEAADMEIYYRQRIEENPLPKGVEVSLSREINSNSTISNIDNFLQQVDMTDQLKRHVYIISSLFHLPRFIDLTTNRISELNMPIHKLTFVSAENPWKNYTPAVAEVDYLKSCMYEFFLQLYKEQDIARLFHPVTQNC